MDSADDFIAAHETTLPKSQNKVEKYLLHIEDNVAAGISLPHPAFLQTRVPFFVALYQAHQFLTLKKTKIEN